MIAQKLKYAGLKINPKTFKLVLLLVSLIGALLITIFSSYYTSKLIYVFLISFFSIAFLIYSWLNLKVLEKAQFVNSILPDILDLTAANLKAGMTPDKALLLSAKPEFGIFKDDIYKAGEEITLGKSLPDALKSLTKKVDSETLEKIVGLILSGYKSGGKLAPLLMQASKSLKKRQIIESKVKATIVSYVAFITIIIVVGAPFLFATATFLIDSLGGIIGNIDVGSASSYSSFTLNKLSLSSEIVVPFLVILLVTTSIMGSLVLGQIKSGKVVEGVKYVIPFAFISIVIFFSVRAVLTALFGI